MAISIGRPIHRRGQAIGIAGSDVLLVTLSSYLKSLHLSPHSVITISEDNGLLVATSAQSYPFDIRNGRGVRRPALLDANLRTFAAGEPAHDDITLLAMRRVDAETAEGGAD
jgi:hypothetical protein